MASKPKPTTTPKAHKAAPKKKASKAIAPAAPVESAKPKPPRIPPFVNGDPTNEVTHVALTDAEVNSKLPLMLELIREETNLKSEFDAAKARYKHMLKSKAEEITKIQSVMAARAEELEVAIYWRYFPRKKIKRKHVASSGKAIGQALPMTPDELKRFMQPDLLDVPPTPKPAPQLSVGNGMTRAGETIPPPKEGESLVSPDDENDDVPAGSEEFEPSND